MYGIENPYPLTQHILCNYVSYLGKDSLAPATIKVYLSALRRHQISQDLPSPDHAAMPKLQAVQVGVAKAHAISTAPEPTTQKRLPITPPILRAIKMVWNSSATEHDTIMLWAICTLAFFGFFRLGEIIPSGTRFELMQYLAMGDIAVDDRENPSLLQVHLKISKTDQLRKGTDIYIGKTDDDICPVAAVLAFLAVRGQTPGPLFICHDGKSCTKDWFIPKLRSALETAGLDAKNFAGHSFHIGAATTAAERGLEDST